MLNEALTPVETDLWVHQVGSPVTFNQGPLVERACNPHSHCFFFGAMSLEFVTCLPLDGRTLNLDDGWKKGADRQRLEASGGQVEKKGETGESYRSRMSTGLCVRFMTAAEPLGHRVTMQLNMHADVSGNIGEYNSVGGPIPEKRPVRFTLYGPNSRRI